MLISWYIYFKLIFLYQINKMSKSTLKLKKFNIFNLNDYYKSLSDDILQEEEDIIDIIYEPS